jgi:hypothetical protein
MSLSYIASPQPELHCPYPEKQHNQNSADINPDRLA